MKLDEARSGIAQKFFDLCNQVTADNGLELYDLEYYAGQKILRLYIINKATGTAQLEECAKIDHALTPYFDSEEWMPEEVTLEVSSPGVYRSLKTEDHFRRAVDERIALVLSSKMETLLPDIELPKKLKGQKRIKGVLVSFENNIINLDIDGLKVPLNLESIKKVNVDPPEFDF